MLARHRVPLTSTLVRLSDRAGCHASPALIPAASVLDPPNHTEVLGDLDVDPDRAVRVNPHPC
ncbi:hypothetical protein CKO25_01400 [Thiocapsa imhoffii]|uniref:Uncharacterized protein n=1 Tax=Thiocapsa imhoffii TaxID=382777 RepID=A0A9X0WF27_9GAMM|nr:hypothetical protein [Thiocapsa imhoffii]